MAPLIVPDQGEEAAKQPAASAAGRFVMPPCIHVGSGKDYPVGAGHPLAGLGDVPWQNLGAGDTVRLHWRAEPYRDKILIPGRGAPEQPIRLCGVPGPGGQLPTISGDGAVTPADTYFGTYKPMEDLGLITIYNPSWNEKPAHVTVEGLAITQAMQDYSYKDTEGNLRKFASGAAGIRVQEGDYITLRGNRISDCGNGMFAHSKPDNEASLVRHILIEGNHLFFNGTAGTDQHHNLYIQAIGAVYQYNYFGRNRPGSLGANLKDRSPGTIVRYNWFEGGRRQLDLVEVMEHGPWVIEKIYRRDVGGNVDPERLKAVRAAEVLYRNAYVYGNQFRTLGSTDSAMIIHYGMDSMPDQAREGDLWCFNNTFVILADQKDHWRTHLLDVSTLQETAHFFNNIAVVLPETPGQNPSELTLMRESGNLHLGVNLLSPGWVKARDYGDVKMDGVENLITTERPLDRVLDSKTLELIAGSPAIDAAEPAPDAVNQYPLTSEYHQPLSSADRRLCGSASDLGAREFCPTGG